MVILLLPWHHSTLLEHGVVNRVVRDMRLALLRLLMQLAQTMLRVPSQPVMRLLH